MKSILIIEDHSIVRVGLQSLLEKYPEYTVIGSYSSGKEGLDAIKLRKPDIVILDLNLPDLPGEIVARDLFLNDSETEVVVLTCEKYVPQVVHLLKLGIKAYVIKDFAAKELPEALNEIAEGNQYISPSMKGLLEKMGALPGGSKTEVNQHPLTEREKEVAKLLCKGLKGDEVASQLGISPVTVRVHTKNILRKLKIDNLKELAQIRDQLF